jgi:tRNA(adenine34) deaminase
MPISEPTDRDIELIDQVLAEANAAIDEGKAGVGALLAWRGQIIALGHNMYEETRDVTSHGEMTILRTVAKKLDRMSEQEKAELCMYVTLEPCLMCLSAMAIVGIKRIVYSALSEDANTEQWVARDITARSLNDALVRGPMALLPGVRREAGVRLLERMDKAVEPEDAR